MAEIVRRGPTLGEAGRRHSHNALRRSDPSLAAARLAASASAQGEARDDDALRTSTRGVDSTANLTEPAGMVARRSSAPPASPAAHRHDSGGLEVRVPEPSLRAEGDGELIVIEAAAASVGSHGL